MEGNSLEGRNTEVKVRKVYTLRLGAPLPEGFRTPLVVEKEGKRFEIPQADDAKRQLIAAHIEAPVDPTSLELWEGPQTLNGEDPPRSIYIPKQGELHSFLEVMVDIISFLTDTPIRISHKLGGDFLIPESSDDERLLAEFGTDQLFTKTHIEPSVRSFSMPEVSSEEIEKMAAKEAGFALYAQAIQMSNNVGRFREFWKVLESAFGQKDDELVTLLATYEPAVQLGFDKNELRNLLILRGRASHAESGAGIEEYHIVRTETGARLARLKCLAEQVLLTKRTWGTPTTHTDRLAALDGFIDSEGRIVLLGSDELN